MEPERERLADAVRHLIEITTTSDAPAEELERAAAEVERLAEQLAPHPRHGFKTPHLPNMDELQRSFWRDPVIGRSNPIAPPVDVKIIDERVVGTATLGLAHEGPPGYVHGAIIAAVFDQMLGLANLASGNAGMTGTLTVKYRSPTPLHTDLLFEAQTERVAGRKIFTKGTLHASDTLTAEAEGLFVNLRLDRAAELFVQPG